MRDIMMLLFLTGLNLFIGVSKKRYPEFWEKYTPLFRVLWTVLGVLFIGVMGCGLWYLLATSNVGAGTKVFNGLIILGIMLVYAVLVLYVWKKWK